VGCGGVKEPERTYCSACQEKSRNYVAARVATRRAAGQCITCGGTRKPGLMQCQECRDYFSAKTKGYRAAAIQKSIEKENLRRAKVLNGA
jgi:hypothetical protein